MKIKLIEVDQYGKKSYLGMISFDELDKIVKLTFREEKEDNALFQRSEETGKVKEISQYMEKEDGRDIPLFATPIVIGINTDDINNENSVFLDNGNSLNIPDDLSTFAIIVDGQHRYKGMKKYFSENPGKSNGFQIPVVFLLDYDLFELGKIFININFKQKPVNKSLYYDIFGSLPDSISEIKIAHMIAKDLNTYENSPLKGIFKMLGKGEGLISQSFFVEKVTKLLSKDSIWLNNYLNIYSFFSSGDDISDEKIRDNYDYIKIKDFMFDYFNVIKTTFEKYFENSILFKTTGMGVWIRLIEDIYLNSKENNLEQIFENIHKEGENRFGVNSNYSKGGSEGLQQRLYKEVSTKLFYKNGKQIVKDGLFSFNIGEQFSFKDIHSKVVDELIKNYPGNNFIEAKILQLLQVLRDEGYLEFVQGKRGVYKLLKKNGQPTETNL